MPQQVSGLQLTIPDTNPPRSFIHEIAFKKVNDVALSCLEQLVYLFIKIFWCCSSYDKFYGEEIINKYNRIESPVVRGGPAFVSREAQGIPVRGSMFTTLRREGDEEGVVREASFATESLPQQPEGGRIRSRTPSPVRIARKQEELGTLECFASTAVRVESLASESIGETVPKTRVHTVQNTFVPSEIRADRLSRGPDTLVEEAAPVISAEASARVEPTSLARPERFQFENRTRSQIVTAGSGNEYLEVRNKINNKHYKVLFCERGIYNKWFTEINPPLQLGGKIIVRDHDDPVLKFAIEMYNSSVNFFLRFLLNANQLFQQLQINDELVPDELFYVARASEDIPWMPPVKEVNAPPLPVREERVESTAVREPSPVRIELQPSETEPKTVLPRVDWKEFRERIERGKEEQATLDRFALTEVRPESIGETVSKTRVLTAQHTIVPPGIRADRLSIDPDTLVEEVAPVAEPAKPVRTEDFQFKNLSNSTIVTAGWGNRFLQVENQINDQKYRVLFCQHSYVGKWHTDYHSPLQKGGKMIVKDYSDPVTKFKIEIYKPDGTHDQTYLLDVDQLYQETTGQEYVYVARLDKDRGSMPTNVVSVLTPERTSYLF